MEMNNLKIISYNSKGHNIDKLEYIKKMLKFNDIVLVQEHWLQKGQLHMFEQNISGIQSHNVSGMDGNVVHNGILSEL